MVLLLNTAEYRTKYLVMSYKMFVSYWKSGYSLILSQIDWWHMLLVQLLEAHAISNQTPVINLSTGIQKDSLYLYLISTFLTLLRGNVVDWYLFWNRIHIENIWSKNKDIYSNIGLSNNLDAYGSMLTGL